MWLPSFSEQEEVFFLCGILFWKIIIIFKSAAYSATVQHWLLLSDKLNMEVSLLVLTFSILTVHCS